ncbi:MAG: pyridoxal phosphate-dependent aminotransferase [Fimbriimonadales bacterium]|nr:pyridoxal phosphate-dependent aminotransferase [Fimbriimonadales bacterium]
MHRLLSERARQAQPSPTLALTARAQELRQQGVDVLSFTAGEPDFDTPEFAKTGALEAIHAGYTKYTPTPGILPLREAISEKFERENGLRYAPDQIVVSCGAKHSLFGVFMAILDPGDEVIIPTPCWVSYPEQVKLMGATPVFVPADESTDFLPEYDALRRAITKRTKAIVLNTPCNPTGAVFGRRHLKEIASLALTHDLWIVADEIYEHLTYDGYRHESIGALSKEVLNRTITVNGVSKSFAMTGWRIGYLGAPPEVARAVSRLQDQMTSNACTIAQYAALAALQNADDTWYESIRATFDRRRRLMVDGLSSIDGLECWTPRGAFYVYVNVRGLIGRRAAERTLESSADVAEFLLCEARVATVPGEGFCAPGYVRLSYATAEAIIQAGIERIGEAVAKLEF